MRVEIFILLAGLASTVWAKLVVLQRAQELGGLGKWAQVSLPDILFFASVLLVIRVACLLKPHCFVARCSLVLSSLILVWSALNICWLLESGVQLQPGVLMLAVQNPVDFWPLVQSRVATHKVWFALSLVVLIMVVVGFVWLMLRPGKVVANRVHHVRWAVGTAFAIVVLSLIRGAAAAGTNLGLTGEAMSFSSHCYALAWTVGQANGSSGVAAGTRNIPCIGERQVVLPQSSADELPNVVLVLLESIPHSATSLGSVGLETTPNLAQLAREGVEFRLTRVPVSHTTKALWAVLTGSSPIIEGDYCEAIVADEGYESLASLLGRAGYRSAFFEMSKGSFECAPGLFHNLGFDWAWFRENLEDPSAYTGILTGDDCCLIDPACDWAAEETRPFLLAMITTIAHEPYTVPDWYGKPEQDFKDRYYQTVRFTDYFLGQLCQGLQKRGLDDNTILCVIGDHGLSLREETRSNRWHPFEEMIHVPWVLRWPGHVQAGGVVEDASSQMDVTPTLLKLIGFDISDAGFEGVDALSPSGEHRRCFFSSWYSNSPRGFVQDNRKVIYWPYVDKVFEYDLSVDPDEKHPVPILSEEKESIKQCVLAWQERSRIEIDPKRFTGVLLFSHWQTFCTGRSGWAYYVP